MGALMTGLTVRESVTVAGRAQRARVARTFVGTVLGARHLEAVAGQASVIVRFADGHESELDLSQLTALAATAVKVHGRLIGATSMNHTSG